MQEFLDGKVALYAGDCRTEIQKLADNSIDSCVTDPPYSLVSIVKRFGKEGSAPVRLNGVDINASNDIKAAYARASAGFMGKQWDTGEVAFDPAFWAEVLRVLKPGGHVLAMGGTRTYHRLVVSIEDAGFEIRDCIGWLYATGFPKSHDVSKSLDGVIGKQAHGFKYKGGDLPTNGGSKFRSDHPEYQAYQPQTDAVRQWAGWGTALKPAMELICLARKPLSESTVAANVLKHGTGALNIDATRIPTNPDIDDSRLGGKGDWSGAKFYHGSDNNARHPSSVLGRWPANLIHDGSEEVVAVFPDRKTTWIDNTHANNRNGEFLGQLGHPGEQGFNDSGSAARFFYQAKADAMDRLGSSHPTIKPVNLIQYLVRLITPPGGTVLDPFAGTGTTGEAAYREGFRAVLIEREDEYQKDIARRMDLVLAGKQRRRQQAVLQKATKLPMGKLFGT